LTRSHALFSSRRRWADRARAVLIACSVACAGVERAAPRAAPVDELPLPPHLDLAVRIDATALGADLGEAPTRQFLLDALAQGEPGETAKLLERSLARAALLWVGVPVHDPARASGTVLVLRGRFASLGADGAALAWSRPDAGAETLDFAGGDAGYARAYLLPGNETMIWTSRSELTAVERALRGESSPLLRPPERGAVSFAARPEGLLERYGSRYPELADRLRGVRRIEAFAEPTSGMWRADLTLDFASAEQASDVSAVIERLKQVLGKRRCAVGVLARATVVSCFLRNVRVQAVLLEPEVEAVKACVLGNGCCG
jgi:hypothetical protein